MRGNPFISRNRAFLFAGVTLFGAMMAVGGEETDGVIDRTTDKVAGQREDFARDMAELESPQESVSVIEPRNQAQPETVYAEPSPDDDEFLIDDTQGFDPTPEADTYAPMLTPEGSDPIFPDELALPEQ